MPDQPTLPHTAPALHDDDGEYEKRWTDYRAYVKAGRDDGMDSYDKGILTVSGGALALAFGFVKTSSHPPHKWLLITSWVLFGLSLLSTLALFRSSHLSFDRLLRQLDAGVPLEHLRERPGGRWTKLTHGLNQLSWVFLLVGIIALGVFIANDRGHDTDRGHDEEKAMTDKKVEITTPTLVPIERVERGRTPTAPAPARIPPVAGSGNTGSGAGTTGTTTTNTGTNTGGDKK